MKYVETTVDWSDDSDCWTWPTLQTLDLMTWIFVLFLMFFYVFMKRKKHVFYVFYFQFNVFIIYEINQDEFVRRHISHHSEYSESYRWRQQVAVAVQPTTIAERPRDASCLLASTEQYLERSLLLLVTSASDLLLRTNKLCSVVFGVTSLLPVINKVHWCVARRRLLIAGDGTTHKCYNLYCTVEMLTTCVTVQICRLLPSPPLPFLPFPPLLAFPSRPPTPSLHSP